MNFALAGQNSFVWFIAHAYMKNLFFVSYLSNSGMMKDS